MYVANNWEGSREQYIRGLAWYIYAGGNRYPVMDISSSGKRKEKGGKISVILAKNSAKSSRKLRLYTDDESNGKHTAHHQEAKVLELSKERVWRNHDILYWVLLSSESKKSGLTKKRSEKYLYVFHNADQSSAYVVIVHSRGKEIEIKQSWNMSDIRSIKSGLNVNEFVFFTADEKLVWEVSSNVLRDEAIWVLVHICKYLCNNDIKIDAHDIQDLHTAISSSGTLNKFPTLKQALDRGMAGKEGLMGPGADVLAFTAEETDAEQLFDEMQWGASGTESSADPVLLQGMLKSETDTLHIEICDFLLQWEAEDDSPMTRDGGEGGGTSTGLPPAVVVAEKHTRETLELLRVLDNVDMELGCVDEWLTGQINYLSGVQLELHQIESENRALETSWHNLSAVKQMITQLLDGPLCLRQEHEIVLRAPLGVMQAALADKDLSHSTEILQPLEEALHSLRAGLNAVHGKNSFDTGQWDRLQTMSAVSHQRHVLMELSDVVCHQLVDVVSTLFRNILSHKAINNPSRQDLSKEQGDYGRTVIVRKFSFSSITNKVKEQQGRFLVDTPELQGGAAERGPSATGKTGGSVGGGGGGDTVHRLDSSNEFMGLKNQLLGAQRTFHTAVQPFLPILHHLSALRPSLADTIQTTYTDSSSSHLYQPLFKVMFTELFAAIPHRQGQVFTLATAPRSLARKRTSPTLRFQHPSMCRTGTVLVLSPWTVLAVAVSMLEDVVCREEEFTVQVSELLVGDCVYGDNTLYVYNVIV